jgi:penicillin amidase
LWACLDAAWKELTDSQGADPARWGLRPLRAFELTHPVAGAVRALRPIFSRGPFHAPGDADTIRVGSVAPGDDGAGRVTAAFYRAVYDMGGGESGWAHVPGQSGHPASPNYADLVQGWLDGNLEPMAFGQAPAGSRRLILEPGKPL